MPLSPRQAFAFFRLRWFGRIAPRDICRAFGVARATAAADVASLRSCLSTGRLDPAHRATTADPEEQTRAGAEITNDAREALDLLLAQDRMRRAVGALGPWTSARLTDRRLAARPICADIVKQALMVLEEGTSIDTSGAMRVTFRPTALVRTFDSYRLAGIDTQTGAELEIDLAEVAPGWRLNEAPTRPDTAAIPLLQRQAGAGSTITLAPMPSPSVDVIQLLPDRGAAVTSATR